MSRNNSPIFFKFKHKKSSSSIKKNYFPTDQPNLKSVGRMTANKAFIKGGLNDIEKGN